MFNFGSVPLTGSAPLLWCTLAFGWSYVTFEVRLAAVIVPSPLRGSFLLVFQEMVAVYVPTGLRAYPTCRVLPSGTSSDPLANRGYVSRRAQRRPAVHAPSPLFLTACARVGESALSHGAPAPHGGPYLLSHGFALGPRAELWLTPRSALG